MSTYKKQYTKPLPPNATLHTLRNGTLQARWKDSNGTPRTAPATHTPPSPPRILLTTKTYTAKIPDQHGKLIEISTGCHSKEAAEAHERRLRAHYEALRHGLTPPPLPTTRTAPGNPAVAPAITTLLDLYIKQLQAAGRTPHYLHHTRQRITTLTQELPLHTLQDLHPDPLINWIHAATTREKKPLAPQTIHNYLKTLNTFLAWTIQRKHLHHNPLKGIQGPNPKANPKHPRRAFTLNELHQLLQATQARPLHYRLTMRRKPSTPPATLTPQQIHHLQDLGATRALIYTLLAYTGLRKEELTALRHCDYHPNTTPPTLHLPAPKEKARRGAHLPLPTWLANDLNIWLTQHPPETPITPLLPVPPELNKILNKDLDHAQIPKTNPQGYTLDIHSLRYTFATQLALLGTPRRTAMAAMRHTDPHLTDNIYTDPTHLDLNTHIQQLPPPHSASQDPTPPNTQ